MFITLMPSPHPRENYIVTLPKIYLEPLWQTEIFLPLEKIMDPRMMLAGINRRYEYIGDHRYTHRCTRVTCSCYFDVSSMKSFISCQSSKNCPRSTLLAEKNCARCLKLKYDTPRLYTLRGSRLSFPWKGGVDGRGISEFAGGREVRGIFHKLN